MNDYRGIQAYRRTDLQTIAKEKLIVLLYEKMLEHFDAAAAALPDDRPEMTRRLNLAQRIVTELQNALDFSVGGEIAENLASLYDFVFREILAMQVDRDPAHARNACEVLEPLLAAWSAIPPGTGDRALRPEAGTQPAPDGPTQSTPPAPEEPAVSQSISFSA
jgi:flagellar protein FliS